jgi:hypothetical protein
MGSKQEKGKVRAEETMEKMRNPKMEAITDEFARAFNVRPPLQFTEIFLKSWKLQTKKIGIYKEVECRQRYNKPAVLYEMINGKVQEKFSLIYYHQQNAVALQRTADGYIGRIILKANELGIDWPITLCISLGKIHYEYEAFILQCRACIDHFAGSLSYYFGFFAKDLDGVRNKLVDLSSKNSKAKRIIEKIEENKEFYSRLHELLISKTKNADFLSDWSDRDKIAHYGTVLMRPLNIMINPKAGTKVLHFARQEKGKDTFDLPKITEIMESFMCDLFKFIKEIYDIMLEE